MRRIVSGLLTVAVFMGLGTAVRSQEMVVNGGFETINGAGVAVPWVYDGIGIGVTNNPVFMGMWSMEFSRVDAPAVLTQTGFTTQSGVMYLVSFWLYNEEGAPGGVKSFTVSFDGTVYNLGSGPTPGVWTYYSLPVWGTGNTNASLVFSGQYERGSWLLDNVSVVPEPALVQLPFLLGLAGFGYWRRRRNGASA